MMVIRPVGPEDLDDLERLGIESGPGMTNLPADRELLQARIHDSMASFPQEVTLPGEQVYCFALEDTTSGRVVGTSGIIATVGTLRPFYSFQLLHLPHTSQELGRFETVPALQMVNHYRGATEIGLLYLDPTYRHNGNGRFLSRFRFLMLAEFPQRFDDLVMAEMRGVGDEKGRSVFWNSLGKRFLHMEFSKADFLSSVGKYQFIADLMPKYPIYIWLLSRAAQRVIGEPHPHTRPALELLRREGFSFEGLVDVFDAGPTIHCHREQIRTVMDSRRALVGGIVPRLQAGEHLVAAARLPDFRVARGPLRPEPDGSITLGHQLAQTLRVEVGDSCRYVPF
ncbi:MAG: arginine N-succinyltransferase [Candidatus Competibacteraceae bacterium]|nr:arginine N-succinyltransferase [Candidatus Competibacteraceae bacterium]